LGSQVSDEQKQHINNLLNSREWATLPNY
jgi:hypothetical protein